jgi:hypothetical protein
MVFKFSGCLVKEKMISMSLLPSLKTVANSKSVPKAASKFLFLLSFADIGPFSPVNMPQPVKFSKSQAAFGTTFRVTGSYLKARISFLKKVTGSIFRVSK